MCIDGVDTNDPEVVNATLNQHFASVGPNLASNIPPSPIHFSNYLPPTPNCSFYLHRTDRSEIRNLISTLKSGSSGYDGVSTKVIKFCIDPLTAPLTYLTNLILRTGIFPDQLKIAKVTPLPKNGSPINPDNFRPISVLTGISKVVERVISVRLTSYLEENNLLSEAQHGSRKARSTDTALHSFLKPIYSALDSKQCTIATFLDLKKAFDSIPHDSLLQKLRYFGITGKPLKLLESYLTGRKQFVSHSNNNSPTVHISYGVPQGSILGPILFLIYINDITRAAPSLSFSLYVDDTTVTITRPTMEEAQSTINSELSSINKWINANGLTLNVEKSAYMVFHRTCVDVGQIRVSIDHQTLNRVEQFKFLGVILDNKLKWKLHIEYVRNKISKICGLLYRIRQQLDTKSLLTIYNSLIYTSLVYGVIFWGGACPNFLKQLVIIQKRALRTIFFMGRRQSTQDVFNEYTILR